MTLASAGGYEEEVEEVWLGSWTVCDNVVEDCWKDGVTVKQEEGWNGG